MAGERARAGGGHEISLTNYTIGSTYGNTASGSAWFGPGNPMSPQAPEEVKGRAFDFPQGYNTYNTTRAGEPITYGT
ncbi:hypothetical protein, partial [Corallococcus praedator]|uniref:hypothetical protein n=1 Tax=Corallococcus praedator TaxID=2316724 RepID=UPI001ABF83F1